MTHSQDSDASRVETDEQASLIELETARANVDEEPASSNQREFTGARHWLVAILCVSYTVFHLLVMNVFPLETWTYRLMHVGGGLLLGYLLFGATDLATDGPVKKNPVSLALLGAAGAGILFALSDSMFCYDTT